MFHQPWCRHRKTQPQNDLQRRSPRKIPHASSGGPETSVIYLWPFFMGKGDTHKHSFSKEDQIHFCYQTLHLHLAFTWESCTSLPFFVSHESCSRTLKTLEPLHVGIVEPPALKDTVKLTFLEPGSLVRSSPSTVISAGSFEECGTHCGLFTSEESSLCPSPQHLFTCSCILKLWSILTLTWTSEMSLCSSANPLWPWTRDNLAEKTRSRSKNVILLLLWGNCYDSE